VAPTQEGRAEFPLQSDRLQIVISFIIRFRLGTMSILGGLLNSFHVEITTAAIHIGSPFFVVCQACSTAWR
jgi:hypothetical protein